MPLKGRDKKAILKYSEAHCKARLLEVCHKEKLDPEVWLNRSDKKRCWCNGWRKLEQALFD